MTKIVLNPNCSEAVFRFHTADYEEMGKILNAIEEATGSLESQEAKTEINESGGYFTLNIRNNDLGEGNWIDIIANMGIMVEEAEYSKELQKIKRDCTCGNTYFDGYDCLIKDEDCIKVKVKKDGKTYRIAKVKNKSGFIFINGRLTKVEAIKDKELLDKINQKLFVKML